MKATISTTRVLAIDLGKFKSVACFYEVATRTSTFCTIDTSNDQVRKLLQDERGITVVIEACSPAGWVHDLCGELGVRCLVANTNGDAWAWKNVKRKTDKDDALKPARLAAVAELAVAELAVVPSRVSLRHTPDPTPLGLAPGRRPVDDHMINLNETGVATPGNANDRCGPCHESKSN